MSAGAITMIVRIRIVTVSPSRTLSIPNVTSLSDACAQVLNKVNLLRGRKLAAVAQVAGEERLTGGEFYGNVVSKQAVGGAIFTELQHS